MAERDEHREQRDEVAERAHKALADSQEWQRKVVEQVARNTDVRPTPTQEELDKAALGAHVVTHEDDGSPLDPRAPAWSKHEVHEGHHETRQETARPPSGGAGYQTRQARPVTPTSTTSGAPS
jgi:hypothetical protein